MPDATKAPKIQAKDNPWYLLATLYGQPTPKDDELRVRNRSAWNRYMARFLDDAGRELAKKKGPVTVDAATPFTDEELPAVEAAFAERRRQAGSMAELAIPDPTRTAIDFTNVEFDRYFRVAGFVFPTPSDFSGATFSKGGNFGDAIFFKGGKFGDATFSGFAFFTGAIFSGWAFFNDATFAVQASFERAIFGLAFFNYATFSGRAAFKGAAFESADFEGATFSEESFFQSAIFSGRAGFKGAIFSGRAGFKGATFSQEALFHCVTFSEEGNVERAIFSGQANFNDATFSGRANFQGVTFESEVSFVNAEMKSETSFESAAFRVEPPRFFGAKLHEGTDWGDVTWPDPPADTREARRFLYAYERLKLEMDRLKKHGDELDFFARELQSRRVYHGDWKPLKSPEINLPPKARTLFRRTFATRSITIPARTIAFRPAPGLPIALYGLLSGYGRSYARPLLGLAITAIAGALLFWTHFGFSKLRLAFGLSLANTFGVFGFRKDFIESSYIEHLPGLLKIVSGAQTIIGGVLLFLFGLAIRNRFRIK